jgi:hypothetical protein
VSDPRDEQTKRAASSLHGACYFDVGPLIAPHHVHDLRGVPLAASRGRCCRVAYVAAPSSRLTMRVTVCGCQVPPRGVATLRL